MNAWQLAFEHPELACFALCVVAWIAAMTIYRCWALTVRMLNIRKHGWPPPHCDAEGESVEWTEGGDES